MNEPASGSRHQAYIAPLHFQGTIYLDYLKAARSAAASGEPYLFTYMDYNTFKRQSVLVYPGGDYALSTFPEEKRG